MPKRPLAWESTVANPHRSDLEYLLCGQGACEYKYSHAIGEEDGRDYGQFEILMRDGRVYRFSFALPERDDSRFTRNPRGYGAETFAEERAAKDRYNQAVASRWRVFMLYIKEKLLSATELFSFDQEFLPYLVLPSG